MPTLPQSPRPVQPRFSDALLRAVYGVEPPPGDEPEPLDEPAAQEAFLQRLAAAAEAGRPQPLE